MIFLRDYQDKAIKNVLTFFKITPNEKPLVVAPTGSGKSVIIAGLIQKCLEVRKDLRVLVVTHVAELLVQNCNKLLAMMPEKAKDISFYCDSLDEKIISQITLGSIQSIYDKANLCGKTNLLLIDECHLIPKKNNSMYQSFIKDLLTLNPKMGIVGFTATPFRTDSGLLTGGEDKIFDQICYDISIRELIERGFHAHLISKHSSVQADLSNVKVRGGDYVLKDLEDVMNNDPLTSAAVNEMIKEGAERKKWLVFCAGVKHAHAVRDEIRGRNIPCEVIFGDMPKDERKQILADFKEGKIKALTNYGVLTTGYDEPEIDMVVLLRGTKSAGLYIQMVGRGSRVAPMKINCKVLDFGGNIQRFGPIDCITVKKSGSRAVLEKLPTKKCPQCGNVLPIKLRFCEECGHEFELLATSHASIASSMPVLNEAVELTVIDVGYKRHKKEGKPDSLRVDYVCNDGLAKISEYVCLEHNGYARHKAFLWWHSHTKEGWVAPLPTVEEAFLLQNKLKRPKKIRAIMEGKFWRILYAEYWAESEEIVLPKNEKDELHDLYDLNI